MNLKTNKKNKNYSQKNLPSNSISVSSSENVYNLYSAKAITNHLFYLYIYRQSKEIQRRTIREDKPCCETCGRKGVTIPRHI